MKVVNDFRRFPRHDKRLPLDKGSSATISMLEPDDFSTHEAPGESISSALHPAFWKLQSLGCG
jgi:hypothetical protein